GAPSNLRMRHCKSASSHKPPSSSAFGTTHGKQKLTISQLLLHNMPTVFFAGGHVLFLAAIHFCGPDHAGCGCVHRTPCSRLHPLSPPVGAKSSSFHGAQ